MINEAFWFFYIVGLVGSVAPLVAILTLINVCALAIMGLMCDNYGEPKKRATARFQRLYPRMVGINIFIILVAFITPSKTALYAGAGQYVVQTTEIDDTLLQLKNILDTKIAELTETE